MDEAEFTEEDKQIILDILKNCYCGYGVSSGEVAKIIQNRMSFSCFYYCCDCGAEWHGTVEVGWYRECHGNVE